VGYARAGGRDGESEGGTQGGSEPLSFLSAAPPPHSANPRLPSLRCAASLQSLRGAASKKAEALRGLLSPGGVHADLAGFACPCPLDPSVQLLGLVPSECSVFKSAMTPLRLTFRARLPGGSSMLSPGGGDGGNGGGSGDGSQLQQSHEQVGRMASLTLASQHSYAASDGGGGGSHSGSRRQSLSQLGAAGLAASPGPPEQLGAPAESAGAAADGGQQLSPASSGRQDSMLAQEAPTALVTLIYKRGDDLRQDQLVVQMISLMDRCACWARCARCGCCARRACRPGSALLTPAAASAAASSYACCCLPACPAGC
jgi:hypothetical protein